MTKIVGKHGMSEIVIISDEAGILVYVWQKWDPTAQPIGAYLLEKTKAESIEKAKEDAASAIADKKEMNIETVRKDIEWVDG